MPAPIQPADTVQPVDTPVQQHFVPSYSDGFPAAAAGDSTLGTIDTLPVMELPPTGKSIPFTRSPLHDTPSMALLITGLLAVALSYHSGYKYIGNLVHYLFSTRRRGNMFEDHTLHETTMLTALMANTCIVQGFIIYLAVQLLFPSYAPQLRAHTFMHISLFTGLSAGFMVIQWLVFNVLGYTFSDKVGARLWMEGFKAMQSVVGLALLPVLVPLFISAFRRADELAVAMESRCYHGGEGRTRMNILVMRSRDWIALAVCLAVLAVVIVLAVFGL